MLLKKPGADRAFLRLGLDLAIRLKNVGVPTQARILNAWQLTAEDPLRSANLPKCLLQTCHSKQRTENHLGGVDFACRGTWAPTNFDHWRQCFSEWIMFESIFGCNWV